MRGTVPRLAERFVAMAIVYAILGMCVGIAMAIRQDFSERNFHAHINLVGWATLALYGVVYRVWPALAERRLALAQFWTAATGTPLLVAGMFIFERLGTQIVVMIGAPIVLLSMVLFLANFLRRRKPA